MALRNYRVSDLNDQNEALPESVFISLSYGEESEAVSIDLSQVEYDTLKKALKKYFENGVEVNKRTRSGNTSGNGDADRNAEIRAWAQVKGNLPEGVKAPADRGRLSADVITAFEKAHAETGVSTE